MIKYTRPILMGLILVLIGGLSLTACKKEKKKLEKKELQLVAERRCDSKHVSYNLAIPDAGELYLLMKKMGIDASLRKSVEKNPIKLAKAMGAVAPFIVGVAMAEQTLMISSENMQKSLERLNLVYKKVVDIKLLDTASQRQIMSFLLKLKSVKKTQEFQSFLAIMRSEFLKKMDKPSHRFKAVWMMAGGVILAYHEISLIALKNKKFEKQVGDILAITTPISFLSYELGNCFAHTTKKYPELEKLTILLKNLETLLVKQSRKRDYGAKSFKMITSITGQMLKDFR